MKFFQCSNCHHPIFFENTSCEQCGMKVGYMSGQNEMYALDPNATQWSIPELDNKTYRYCSNHEMKVCNWLMEVEDDSQLCEACDLNRTIPNLEDQENVRKWRKLEIAKHRLVYTLVRFNLPINNKIIAPKTGLAFDFLCNCDPDKPVLTGHASGLITINLDEADSVHREYIRRKLSEPYRTLIGHFRHEIGHYYWEILVLPKKPLLGKFRDLFGFETEDYAASLRRHYNENASADWHPEHISKYAASHPWEDWAETWAHYFHMIDKLETAYSFGLSLDPPQSHTDHLMTAIDFDPYLEQDFDKIVEAYLPVTLIGNSLNRGMGIPDSYPFVLTPSVIEKMRFIHELVHGMVH